jgi:hypothetical protein
LFFRHLWCLCTFVNDDQGPVHKGLQLRCSDRD